MAVGVAAVVVADLTVRLQLQVLQVLPVLKALQAQHFIFPLHTTLRLILLFNKWLK
jgi:type II secretory pathway component PulK